MRGVIRNLSDFDEVIKNNLKNVACFCPKCKMMCYGELEFLYTDEIRGLSINPQSKHEYIYKHTCAQCENEIFLIKHPVDGQSSLTFVYNAEIQYDWSCVPDGINYYMAQAFKSRSVGANSAAMAMYRSALEWLLFSLGFKEKDLNIRIDQFEESEYSEKIGTEFMDILRLLGNNAVHVNDGDLSLQKSFDDDLLNSTEELLNELINQIFIGPEEHKKRVEKMKSGLTEAQLKRYQKEYESPGPKVRPVITIDDD